VGTEAGCHRSARAVEHGRAAADEAPGERAQLASRLEALAERLGDAGRDAEEEAARTEAASLRSSGTS
jgi:hypothetical protein